MKSEQNMTNTIKRALNFLLWTSVAAILLWFSFRGVAWKDFVSGLKECKLHFIGLSMAASVVAFWLRALRWKLLINPIDSSISTKTSFNAINIGYIVNLALPRAGEFVRCGVITDNSERGADGKRKASYEKVLGTAVTDRVWDVATMGILLILMLIFMWNRYGAFFMEKIFRGINVGDKLWAILAALAAAGLAGIYTIWKLKDKSRICNKLYYIARGIFQGISSCMKMKQGWKFFVFTALIWGMYWLMSISVLLALKGIDPSAMDPSFAGGLAKVATLDAGDALFLMMAGSLSSLVPVPGGFGAFHYTVALALSYVYGIPMGLGIIFGTLSHESQVVTEIIFGVYSYFSEYFTRARRTHSEAKSKSTTDATES